MSGGRGVLGILFIAVGLFGIYEVLTGRFPSSTPLVSSGGGGSPGGKTGGPVAGDTGFTFKNPLIPTDIAASRGGFK